MPAAMGWHRFWTPKSLAGRTPATMVHMNRHYNHTAVRRVEDQTRRACHMHPIGGLQVIHPDTRQVIRSENPFR